jgi:hypothetical protein
VTRRALLFRVGASAGILSLVGITFILGKREPSSTGTPLRRQPHQDYVPKQAVVGTTEDQVKGILIHRIVDEVEWPASSFDGPAAPLRVGILGRTEVKESLRKALQKPGSIARPVLLVEGEEPGALANCHVVFIPEGWKEYWDRVLKDVARPGVLTIGEEEGFLGAGGMMVFRIQDKRVRFSLDRPKGERSGLKFTARLLELAEAP